MENKLIRKEKEEKKKKREKKKIHKIPKSPKHMEGEWGRGREGGREASETDVFCLNCC